MPDTGVGQTTAGPGRWEDVGWGNRSMSLGLSFKNLNLSAIWGLDCRFCQEGREVD